MAINGQTAPGVYVQVVDDSQSATVTSQYLPGMVGVAEKGPFDVPTPVSSFSDFVNKFGQSIPGQYLATAAQIICPLTDGVSIVRVGNHYEAAAESASGSAGTNVVYTPNVNLFTANDYVRVSQAGKSTTVNGRVLNTFPNANPPYFTLVPTGVDAMLLADNYTSAVVDIATAANASNPAEGFLDSYTYTAPLTDGGHALTCDANKNSFTMQVSGVGGTVNASDVISPGDILKISQTGRNTTREILVLQVLANNTVFFQTSSRSDIGYQAIALQDSYVSASITPPTIQKVVMSSGFPVLAENTVYITASSDGTWANSANSSDGLVVTVHPGSNADSKKLVIYLNGALTETIDNLDFVNSASANYAPTVINGNSATINVVINNNAEPPANTRQPWNLQAANVTNLTGLANGFNGENASTTDFIGTLDPNTDTMTGLQAFGDTQLVSVNQVFAPGRSDTAILQELAILGVNNNIDTIGDIPFGLTGSEAIDWHNGEGVYAGQGRINNAYLTLYWNWGVVTDYFTGNAIWCPPSVGAARAFAATFNNYGPWFAAAGPKRGIIPEFQSLQFMRLSNDVLNAMSAGGNSVNPIMSLYGVIQVNGEKTMQVTNSDLSDTHVVNLLNNIVENFSSIGRQFIFDPNDTILLGQIRSAFNTYLQTIVNARGIEGYSLVCDSSNNTAATRNQRMVVVGLYVIPVETMQQLKVTINVNSSGATLPASSPTS